MKESIFIAIQDHTGDSKKKLTWDKYDVKARDLAQKEFRDLQEKGYRIFSVKKVLGVFSVKGEELEELNLSAGKIYYEKDTTSIETEGNGNKEVVKKESVREIEQVSIETATSFSKEDAMADNIVYEDPKMFDASKEEVDTDRDYVATKPLYAG